MVFHLWSLLRTRRVCDHYSIGHEVAVTLMAPFVFLARIHPMEICALSPSVLWSMSSCNCQLIYPNKTNFQPWALQSFTASVLFLLQVVNMLRHLYRSPVLSRMERSGMTEYCLFAVNTVSQYIKKFNHVCGDVMQTLTTWSFIDLYFPTKSLHRKML
jgi:hypothetical protein